MPSATNAQAANPLRLAQLLHDWAERHERGALHVDPDVMLARHLMQEALELDAAALQVMGPLGMARWKISWLRLRQRAGWLLSTPPSKRARHSHWPLAVIDDDHIQGAIRRKLGWPLPRAA
jgi:hypothetical protein